jgi:hypothetical protein
LCPNPHCNLLGSDECFDCTGIQWQTHLSMSSSNHMKDCMNDAVLHGSASSSLSPEVRQFVCIFAVPRSECVSSCLQSRGMGFSLLMANYIPPRRCRSMQQCDVCAFVSQYVGPDARLGGISLNTVRMESRVVRSARELAQEAALSRVQ